MRIFYLVGLIFFSFRVFSQDYSQLGKKIKYSPETKNAKRYRDINKALDNAENVRFLQIVVDREGKNYKQFLQHQAKFVNLKKLVIDNRWEQLTLDDPKILLHKGLEFLQIYDLPHFQLEQLSELRNLKYLCLLGCRIDTFPASILKLEQLEFLDLTLNYLKNIPPNISQLRNLKEIDLTNNCFDQIPVELTLLPQLMYLDMNNAEWAKQFADGTSFCYNTISVYPRLLSEFRSLKKVHLYKVTLPPEIKKRLQHDFKHIRFRF